MYTIEDKISFISTTAKAVLADLRVVPDRTVLANLVNACSKIDEVYKTVCENNDTKNNLNLGTTYQNNSITDKFTVSLNDWIPISTLLREICKNNMDDDNADINTR